MADNQYPSFWIVGNAMIDGFIYGFKAYNTSSQMSLIIFRQLNSIIMKGKN